jgi:glucose-1-phosphate thymidylyltransferase
MKTKGIILAGGLGTRLYPSTAVVNKQLQSIYDKPMIYYPISTLMLAGIRDILIITTPMDLNNFERVIGNGVQWGLNISYEIQFEPKGISDAFILGERFIGDDQVCLILGDNLFHGKLDFLRNAIKTNVGGTIFGYEVNDPERYGVVEFDHEGNVLSIEEKPHTPKSNYAIPGLYIFDSDVVSIAKNVKPSARGELEITDVHNEYRRLGKLKVSKMGRGLTWLDTGTPESMLEASQFIHIVETRQSLKVACLEEIALEQKFITPREMETLLTEMPKSPYKNYCQKVLDEYHNDNINKSK